MWSQPLVFTAKDTILDALSGLDLWWPLRDYSPNKKIYKLLYPFKIPFGCFLSITLVIDIILLL